MERGRGEGSFNFEVGVDMKGCLRRPVGKKKKKTKKKKKNKKKKKKKKKKKRKKKKKGSRSGRLRIPLFLFDTKNPWNLNVGIYILLNY